MYGIAHTCIGHPICVWDNVRISGRTEQSGFLHLFQSGDEVMADQGFTIEDLLTPLGVGFNIPLFLAGKQVRLLKHNR